MITEESLVMALREKENSNPQLYLTQGTPLENGVFFYGAARENRTLDLTLTKGVLYH